MCDIHKLRQAYNQATRHLWVVSCAATPSVPSSDRTLNTDTEAVPTITYAPITIEAHISQAPIPPSDLEIVQTDWKKSYEAYINGLQELTASKEIAEQIDDISQTLEYDKDNREYFLGLLSVKISLNVEDGNRFSVEDLTKVLDSLSRLKNDSVAIWYIVESLLPHIQYHTAQHNCLDSIKNLDEIVRKVQRLSSLTDPKEIAEHIDQLSHPPPDEWREYFLGLLSTRISPSVDDDNLFPKEDLDKVLASLSRLKNDSVAIWYIVHLLLPHIRHHTEENNYLVSIQSLNEILSSVRFFKDAMLWDIICQLRLHVEHYAKNAQYLIPIEHIDAIVDSFPDLKKLLEPVNNPSGNALDLDNRFYTTTSHILRMLVSHIEQQYNDNHYIISHDRIRIILKYMSYEATIDILPILLPHIQKNFQEGYIIEQKDIVRIFGSLEDIVYLGTCMQRIHLPHILGAIKPHIASYSAKEVYFDQPKLGKIMKGLRGMGNVEMEQFLATLYEHIAKVNQLNGLTIVNILQGLAGKSRLQTIDNILACVQKDIDQISSFSAKDISLSLSGLRELMGSEKALTVISLMLNKKINNPDYDAWQLRLRILSYSLTPYHEKKDAGLAFIGKTTPIINKIQEEAKNFFNGAFINPAEILAYLAEQHSYQPPNSDSISSKLDMHHLNYSLAKALCEYVMEDFKIKLKSIRQSGAQFTFITGSGNHNPKNAGKMRQIVTNTFNEKFNSFWLLRSSPSNLEKMIIYAPSNRYDSDEDSDELIPMKPSPKKPKYKEVEEEN